MRPHTHDDGRPASPVTRSGKAARMVGAVVVLGTMMSACSSPPPDGGGPAVPPISATSTSSATGGTPSASSVAPGAPTSGTVVCGSTLLRGPATAPPGARTVGLSQNVMTMTEDAPAGTTFWLAPGIHRLGTDQFDQIVPKTGNRFIGAPGAVIDGGHRNLIAFGGNASGVSISYLTIQNFGAKGDSNNEGTINHDSATGWTITRNTVQHNAGAGVFIGDHEVVTKNCLRENGQYGFSAYRSGGVHNLTFDGNEVTANNTDDWEVLRPDCGCSGGGKFWDTHTARVTNNYVHDNHGAGLWADDNNTAFLFQGNYISGNDDEGLIYEISYNAAIIGNTFVRNAVKLGPTNPGFPASAIYISESGSDPRAGSTYGSTFEVSGNVFTDNWAGVVLWENADRFVGTEGSPDGDSTLVNPTVATVKACGNRSLIGKTPYLNDCRWKTQNVKVHDNVFTFTPSHLGAKCTVENTCGFNGVFSNDGSEPSWSPYQGSRVAKAITLGQHNTWSRNAYHGPWNFMVMEVGKTVPWQTWRAAPYLQDTGSTVK